MLGSLRSKFETVPDHVRIELIDMCFQTRVPLAIAGVTLTLIAFHMAWPVSSHLLYGLSVAGVIVTVFRIGSEIVYHGRKTRGALSMREAERWELLYACSSFVFAGLIGSLGAIAFRDDKSSDHLLVTALVFGYAAGIVCRISVRPAIALPALLLVAMPTAVSALSRIEGSFAFYAVILVAFLLGSFETVRFLYSQNVQQISLKHQFATLARNDALTGLANRLGFQERFADLNRMQGASNDLIAVHSVDLDRFKEVNDQYGHPIGDALLRAVAGRLNGSLREGDFAVRMGGDEFVVVQAIVKNREEAMQLGQRIIGALSDPFSLSGNEIKIGASIGVALGRRGDDAETFTAAADEALYASKFNGRSRVTFARHTPIDDVAMTG